ncbi:hypothetical protein [Streptomyces graminilatus]|uniref:hypothetical protein n=1 Tax=Streptomyces graminilatus TaxID=1464070 RepID=UPI000A95062D|nr:hypothetical protein [Streptomyces graminilatus]
MAKKMQNLGIGVALGAVCGQALAHAAEADRLGNSYRELALALGVESHIAETIFDGLRQSPQWAHLNDQAIYEEASRGLREVWARQP